MSTRAAAEPRTFTIEMPAGMAVLNSNHRHSWHYRARVTRELRHTAGWLARARKIPPLEKARVKAEYQPPDKRRRDVSGLAPSFKACIDGLTDAGVWADDDWKHVVSEEYVIGEPFPKGRIVIHVTEVTR